MFYYHQIRIQLGLEMAQVLAFAVGVRMIVEKSALHRNHRLLARLEENALRIYGRERVIVNIDSNSLGVRHGIFILIAHGETKRKAEVLVLEGGFFERNTAIKLVQARVELPTVAIVIRIIPSEVT